MNCCARRAVYEAIFGPDARSNLLRGASLSTARRVCDVVEDLFALATQYNIETLKWIG